MKESEEQRGRNTQNYQTEWLIVRLIPQDISITKCLTDHERRDLEGFARYILGRKFVIG